MSTSTHEPGSRPPASAKGEGLIPCPLCSMPQRTEGWLKYHLKKECPELQSNLSQADAGGDPTRKYKIAALDYGRAISQYDGGEYLRRLKGETT